VPYQHLPNKPTVRPVEPGKLEVTGFDVTSLDLNHPGGALAYRIQGATGDLVYATDHEFGDPKYDEPLADFAKGAAMIVLDAHFTPEELPLHRGWGHSSWLQCAEFAAANGIGSLYLFHHKPGRSDSALEQIRDQAQKVFASTSTASEDATFEL
jgi:ribonuclease BN (tRNA processing enzyme)